MWRYTFLVAILLGSLFVYGYMYYTAWALCNVPISYAIGQVDDEFDFSRDRFTEAVSSAVMVWEASTGRKLFKKNENDKNAVQINLVFDDRQAYVEAEIGYRERLDATESVSQSLRKHYQRLVTEYENLRDTHELLLANYNEEVREFNELIEFYNQEGGVSDETYRSLQTEQTRLANERESLRVMERDINQLVKSINELGEQGNLLIETHNQGVGEYNKNFGESRKFTQGEYLGSVINIYTFTSEQELVLVLAHELGHALGIEHVPGRESIMYELLGEQPEDLSLSEYDMEAFVSVCVELPWWDRLVRKIFSFILT